MKLTFIANACCIYESQGFKLLCDPWLTDGAFYGSWYHYPPLKTRPEDVADFDALYISHLHPDHFDPETLKHFPKDKPVVILDSEPNYLERMVRGLGFTNIAKIKDGEILALGPYLLTMFKPFVKHPFFECELGNIVDSALVIDDGTHKILNTNDNTPDLASAKMLRERFGRFDVAQLNYNAAGPYPSCFNVDQKTEHTNVLTRNLDHLLRLSFVLEPRFVHPFAGAFVLGGKHWQKNDVLGTTTLQDAASVVSHYNKDQRMLCLGEGQSFDTALHPETFELLDPGIQADYIECVLAYEQYPYEHESIPAKPELDCLMGEAIYRVRKTQERFNCYPSCTVLINERYILNLNLENSREDTRVYLKATLDPALLYGILTRKYHWNNAEIGCHIEFERTPNIYQPDVHTLLSFLHA